MRIMSGGQTGVDRAALEVALSLGINSPDDWVGYCPKGRRAEDGRVPDKFKMTETGEWSYPHRTELNVINADATLILHTGKISPGTRLTMGLCSKHQKSLKTIDLGSPNIQEIKEWTKQFQVINIAGPRESSSPGITSLVTSFLTKVLDVSNRDLSVTQ